MIVQEQISDTLVKSYSDKGVYIHGGYPEADYTEAVDPISMNRQYTETDIPIVSEEITAEEAVNIILGREVYGQDDSPEIPDEN